MRGNSLKKYAISMLMTVAFGITGIAGAMAVELFPNGDFADGTINPWTIGRGNAFVSTTVNSPFTNVYADNSKSMEIDKPSGSIGYEGASDFYPVTTGALVFNYDFKITNWSANWQTLAIQTHQHTANILLIFMDASSHHLIFTDAIGDAHILQVQPNTWYNVQLTFDLASWSYTSKITPYGEDTIVIGGRNLLPSRFAGTIGGFLMTESNPAGADNVVNYDNFSAKKCAVLNGYVRSTEDSSVVLTGATVKTTDGAYSTTTDGNGYYFLAVPANEAKTITVSAAGYSSRQATVTAGDDGSNVSHDFALPAITPKAFNYSDNVTVDGNLSEWNDSEFISLDQPYDITTDGVSYLNADIPEAYYAARWGANGNKLYVAVKVRDKGPYFKDNYDTWCTKDAAEIYVHTTGTGDTNYETTNQANAQHYSIGFKTDQTNLWCAIGSGQAVPSYAGFEYNGVISGDWLLYEAAITPYNVFSMTDSSLLNISQLSAGQTIGFDVVVDGVDSYGIYTGMKAANIMTSKWNNYGQFAQHLLIKNSSLEDIKNAPIGSGVSVSGIVSAAFDGYFYIETANRTFGVRVNKAAHGVSAGNMATICGTVSTLDSGEKCIDATSVDSTDSGKLIAPLGMNNKALGGSEQGQPGVSGASGLNNIGLLVKTTGKIGTSDAAASPAYFMIDDGSGVDVKVIGVAPAGATYVTVTGICSCEFSSNSLIRKIIATEIVPD